MSFLILYGIVSAAQAASIFKDKAGSEFENRLFFILQFVRAFFILIAFILLVSIEGKEALFGFWIITCLFCFLFDMSYFLIRWIVMKKRMKKAQQ